MSEALATRTATAAMSRYAAVVFTDLVRHSAQWSRVPRERMVGLVAEYRYVAEGLAAQYGCSYSEWTGDGHMFLFEDADAAVRFGLRLIETWRIASDELPTLNALPRLPLRLGCHFGECTRLGGGEGWIGRANAVAKRVESEADPDTLWVSETLLDLLDLPLYELAAAGERKLKGDGLASRRLYRVVSYDDEALEQRPEAELTAQDWFLKGVAVVGTPRENGAEEEQCYREALRLRPDYAEAHHNLAVVLRAHGEIAEAVAHYQEALWLRPDYPEAHANYGGLLAARGNRAGAEEHYREALRLRPEYVDAHHGLANLLAGLGRLDEAGAHYGNALRLRPEYAEAHNNYAVLLELRGDLLTAERHYRKALQLRPDYAEAFYNYALLLEARGAPAAAEECYREALRLRPEYPEAHNNLGVLLQLSGDLDGAEHHYLLALRQRPDDPEAHYNYGLLLRARSDFEGAERRFRIARELAPESPRFQTTVNH
jgi:Flp pilus assembly protein TadD/class 3 adenylate cyclase